MRVRSGARASRSWSALWRAMTAVLCPWIRERATRER